MEFKNSYIKKQRSIRFAEMCKLIDENDQYKTQKEARCRTCDECDLMGVIEYICAACNCANNKHIFLQDDMDCPKKFWTKLTK